MELKEQVAGTYARKMAQKGYITLAFDSTHLGESGGMPTIVDTILAIRTSILDLNFASHKWAVPQPMSEPDHPNVQVALESALSHGKGRLMYIRLAPASPYVVRDI